MRMIPLFFTAAVFMATLAGCTTYVDIQSDLKRLVGKDIDYAVSLLGEPSQMIQRDLNSVYIWESHKEEHYTDDFTITGPPPGRGSDVVEEHVFASTTEAGCAIKLSVNADDIITGWDFDRGLSRCSTFRRKLNKM